MSDDDDGERPVIVSGQDLEILEYLRSHPDAPMAELEHHFRISEESVQEARTRLEEAGFEVGEEPLSGYAFDPVQSAFFRSIVDSCRAYAFGHDQAHHADEDGVMCWGERADLLGTIAAAMGVTPEQWEDEEFQDIMVAAIVDERESEGEDE